MATTFYEKNFNNCWPPYTVKEISNPNSSYWQGECSLSRRMFDKLPISGEEWQQFENYFTEWRPDEHTWKACHDVYDQAYKSYQPQMTMAELAHRVGILPEAQS
jgi:hypothetical protein